MMPSSERQRPVRVGEPAPDFTLLAADRDGTVSLVDYRSKAPVLLALMRGLYCAFCRRHIERLGVTREKLRAAGVETLAVVASSPERARLYYRHRPPRVRLAADPELITHRAYGVPGQELTPELWRVVERNYGAQFVELGVPAGEVKGVLDRLDGFETAESDRREAEGHGAQAVGQFLIDRDGIVRWVNIESARDGPAGIGKFPTDEELLAAARAVTG